VAKNEREARKRKKMGKPTIATRMKAWFLTGTHNKGQERDKGKESGDNRWVGSLETRRRKDRYFVTENREDINGRKPPADRPTSAEKGENRAYDGRRACQERCRPVWHDLPKRLMSAMHVAQQHSAEQVQKCRERKAHDRLDAKSAPDPPNLFSRSKRTGKNEKGREIYMRCGAGGEEVKMARRSSRRGSEASKSKKGAALEERQEHEKGGPLDMGKN